MNNPRQTAESPTIGWEGNLLYASSAEPSAFSGRLPMGMNHVFEHRNQSHLEGQSAELAASRLSGTAPQTFHQEDFFFKCDGARLKLPIFAPNRTLRYAFD
jgi:hypothetical protein